MIETRSFWGAAAKPRFFGADGFWSELCSL
jgi:hypothetical protein